MTFNYNFQTDDNLISQKWLDQKIGSSDQSLPKLGSKIKLQIRKTQNSDAESVSKINKNSWLKTYPNSEFGITEADILALNWAENLEKAKNNPEYGKNLWLLEIENWTEKFENLNSSNTEKFENEKKVVGFVRFFKNEESLNEIKAIYLDPNFVGLGFGTELMIFAIEKLGFEQNWTVKAASYNQNAIEFYQKFGFKILDTKVENFQLTGEKSIPQIQMIANKDKIQKKIAEIKLKLKNKLENESNSSQNESKVNLKSKKNLENNSENNSENGLKNGLQKQETFTILTPPPNLTGNLHAGHALEHFIMDSLSRRERQFGKNVLYYPGIDHAGIQLEGVINKLIGKGEFDQQIKESFENLTEILPLKIQIRKTKNSDAEKILEINKNSWIATYPSNEFGITKAEIENINWQNKIEKIRQSLETENVNNYVLEIIGNENNSQKWQIVGYISFFENQENFSEIKAIYFDPKFVGRGFGTDLMIFAIEELGFERNFEIKVASYNHNAIQFYQKFGFEKTGINEEFQLLKVKKIIAIQMIVKKEIIKSKIEQIKKQKAEKIDKFSQFQSQKSEDRANWLKKNFAEIWLECAWSKVNLWRDNQKNQSLILGDSPDWDKQLFTLDERAVDMVNLAFENYWRDGLIYRDSYLINWSVALQTALSDVPEDIGRSEQIDPFVTFEYETLNFKFRKPADQIKFTSILEKLKPCNQWTRLKLSTVRIETKFTDLAVAMHPSKFADYFNQNMLEVEFLTKELKQIFSEFLLAILNDKIEVFYHLPSLKSNPIKLIFSEKVDANFGTGIVKVTPGHDMFDYNLYAEFVQKGILENKPIQTCVGRDGKLTEICGEFSGLTVEKARTLILKRLLETGFIPQKNLKN